MSFEGNGRRGELLPAAGLAALFFLVPLTPGADAAVNLKQLLIEAGICTALCVWLAVGLLRSRLPVRQIVLCAPLLAFGGSALFLYFLAPDRLTAGIEGQRVLVSFLAYAAALVLPTERGRALVLSGWIAGSTLVAGALLLQHFGRVLSLPFVSYLFVSFRTPPAVGAELVLAVPLAWGMAGATHRRLSCILSVAASVVMLYGLCVSRPPAAIIGVTVALLVVLMIGLRRLRARLWCLSLMGIVGIGAVVAMPSLQWLQIYLPLWRDALVLWLAHPVIGTGMGTYGAAPNEFARILVETGVVGLGIVLWLMASFFRIAFALSAHLSRRRWLVAGCAGAVAGLLVQDLFSVEPQAAVSSASLFFVMGLVNSMIDEGFVMEHFAPLTRLAGVAGVCCAAAFVLPNIARPYLAQQKVAAFPDSFTAQVLDPVQTAAELEALVRKYPDQPLVFEKLAWVYAREKDWRRAIRNYENVVRLDPGATGALNNLGSIAFATGDHLKAIEYWSRSLAVNPCQVDSRLNLATACYYQGNLKEAARQLAEVLRLDPANEKATAMLRQLRE
jgi:hypothetical protein